MKKLLSCMLVISCLQISFNLCSMHSAVKKGIGSLVNFLIGDTIEVSSEKVLYSFDVGRGNFNPDYNQIFALQNYDDLLCIITERAQNNNLELPGQQTDEEAYSFLCRICVTDDWEAILNLVNDSTKPQLQRGPQTALQDLNFKYNNRGINNNNQ